MRMFRRIRDLPYAVIALVTVASFAASKSASAQARVDDVTDLSEGLRGHIDELGNLVIAGGFLGGIALIAAGLMKLKQAADTQGQQVKYSEGMWRLGVGAALVAVPADRQSTRLNSSH